MAVGANNVVAQETNLTCNVDAILKAVTPTTKLVLARQPQQSDRHLSCRSPRSSACAPACRRTCCWCSIAAYCDYVPARATTTMGIELVDHHREHRGDATPSPEGPRPRRACASAGCSAPRIIDAVNRIRGAVQRVDAGDVWPRSARSRTQAMSRRSSHRDLDRNWLTEEITKLGIEGDAGRRQFRADPLPGRQGKTSDDADAYLTKRGLVLRAMKNYGLPHSLRMTIGTEEANRLVIDTTTLRF